ncbi:NADH-quinone oxidoreductase subunit J [Undibacterium oligocarboniphilum]|uniref:NADH-quinone oxidoreductase subunit J n=1 Tax=Undibacterium oligocarboniphilum TaxID=666702 RepID=A0A850QBQ0_9BURK|nr:NADH-quinone oxidoreductase subunit J [Undibacterium oligocarboniphilum]MBC3869021.1 NADH-quinone oxidoreductase subunit J [Undibacterium oligocarboniphilum]NVO77001.1 NADH-quinone oxidoreductase subunit J [Undibacterium oligocarboniphilum]
MEFTTVLFYVFSAILVLAATQVITARNPVHAALFLVLSFFTAAGIWLLLKAEFLAIVLVLVYVGAVMVLFLFVVMMLDINLDKLRAGFWSHFPLAATVGVVIVLEMSAVLWKGFLRPENHIPASAETIGNTKNLGIVIFTHYQLAFEVAAAILLLAIVAAVALTLRKRKDSKYIDPAQAVKVKSTDRIRIVNMKAESARNSIVAADKQES